MESLIQRGVNVNLLTRDKSAMSALAFHLKKRSLLCVELLLRHGADPCLGGHSQSPTALFIALRSDNVEFLRKVLSRSSETPYVMDWEKPMDVYVRGLAEKPLKDANALHLASAMGSQACLEFLLEKNLIPVKASNSREGWTPLHISAFLGFVQETELLISKGFHVMAENQLGQTPLHLAAQRAPVSIAKLLCKHGASESLDDFGKSPRDYAQERNLVALVNYFETCQDEVGDARHQSRKQRRRLAAALGRAIEAGDQEYCKKLLSRGCTIDVILPGTGGCTPLMLALKLDRPNIAKWLVYRGASTLESVQNSDGTVTSIIEIAAAKPIFNSLLISIVGSYYWHGGDLVYGLDYPLHDAMWSGNIEGIDIILRTWEKLEQDELVKPYPDLNCGQTLQAIVNRRRQTQFRLAHTRETALHIASWKGDKVAASILVEHGAAIDSVDCNGWTPLMYARTVDTVSHLIGLGASPAMICRMGPLPWLVSRCEAEELPIDLISKLPRQLIVHSHFPSKCDEPPITPRHLAALRQLGCSLTLEDECGRSLMHCIISRDETSQLVLEDDYGLPETGPFPWHLDWRPLNKIAFLTTKFRNFQQKVPKEIFQALLNLEPQRGWSPLCRAAALNLVDIIENCLKMGAQIDYEGCPVGSAVMLASACGSLEAVKLLVRRGASVCYFGKNGITSCLALAGTEAVRVWLLSGRFMDQQRIMAEGGGGEEEVKPWSGFALARVKIYGKMERCQPESMLDFARRLAWMKKWFRGQLVRADEVSLSEDTGVVL